MMFVPKEPTTEMKQAGCTIEICDPDKGTVDLTWEEVTEIYKAMINAAPKEYP